MTTELASNQYPSARSGIPGSLQPASKWRQVVEIDYLVGGMVHNSSSSSSSLRYNDFKLLQITNFAELSSILVQTSAVKSEILDRPRDIFRFFIGSKWRRHCEIFLFIRDVVTRSAILARIRSARSEIFYKLRNIVKRRREVVEATSTDVNIPSSQLFPVRFCGHSHEYDDSVWL